jgi:hypothetical protein
MGSQVNSMDGMDSKYCTPCGSVFIACFHYWNSAIHHYYLRCDKKANIIRTKLLHVTLLGDIHEPDIGGGKMNLMKICFTALLGVLLAGNTSLSELALVRIHKTRNPGILWFASNSNCPESIANEHE